MKKITQIILLLFFQICLAQIDYSESWEDFYSYNNVKDFIKVDDDIYAIVDNAVFKYNLSSEELHKISSVNGLSGESTTSIFYSKSFEKLIIGYDTGLLEIIDKKGNITIAKDIVNFNYSGNKQINDITELDNKLYLSTSFAIVIYNIESLQFGDTYFIGDQSTEIEVNEILIVDENIYAATEDGIFTANVFDPSLIDYKSWTHNFTGNFVSIEMFNNNVITSRGRNLFSFNASMITPIKSYTQNIRSLKSSSNYLTISTQRIVNVLDFNYVDIVNYTSTASDEFYFSLNTAYFEEDIMFLGTQEFGILESNLQNISTFEEIHPVGPISNSPFSIAAKDNH
ncbi:MAG: hypothetical protein IZT56_12390, partial [Bacteroidetes bacterium]|nr:hypothetical protein [Bacteroidota bacterium]